MKTGRSNAEWIRDLRSRSAAQTCALEELRAYLLRALPRSLQDRGPVREDLVEDVVQDALVRALERLDTFEGRSRFTTWVTTIAVRLALTELRRHRWKDVSLEALTADEAIAPFQDAAQEARPERESARRAVLRALQQVFETQLSDRQRTAIVAELRGMPQEEIGRRLGISRNAVYKLGYDARRKLKRGLEQSGFDAAEIRSAFD
jgi:RNA polymerase sigma-70 factor (ECF subfamily)